MSGATGSTAKVIFDMDERTKVARTNVKSVAYLSNNDIRRADMIIGRDGIILRDKRGGRTGHRVGAADFARYGATP